MNILRLTLSCRDLAGQRALFVDRLGFEPLASTTDRLALRVGNATLTFRRDPGWFGTYHYALRVPGHRFGDAYRWLGPRVPLLADAGGGTAFYFGRWNAHSVYFSDADGNVAELIARHELDDPSEGPFAAGSVAGLAEVGCVTDDVPGTVAQFGRAYGLLPQFGQAHPEFTAVGDARGLVIVVKPGRPWLPTGQPATPAPFAHTLGAADGPKGLVWQS